MFILVSIVVLQLSKLCKTIKELIKTKRLEQTYDLVDAVHFVPLLIQKEQSISLKAVKKLTKAYAKKWQKLNFY